MLLEQNDASAGKGRPRSKRNVPPRFCLGAGGRCHDRAQLSRADAAVRALPCFADKLLTDSKDVRLPCATAPTDAFYMLGRADEAIPWTALAESRRPTLEWRSKSGLRAWKRAITRQLALDAQQAGFLLIARKAR
jgi:hypothetical protein